MSRSVNKVMLIGNVGADPEVRSTTGGNRVATFSLATSRSWNSPSGDRQEKTEWHRCVGRSPGRSRAPAEQTAGGSGGGGGSDDFEDFPGALEDEDDDLPF